MLCSDFVAVAAGRYGHGPRLFAQHRCQNFDVCADVEASGVTKLALQNSPTNAKDNWECMAEPSA